MVCSRCGIKDANVHYKQIQGGKITELHLCTDCAKELGYIKENESLFNFGSILGDFLSAPAKASANAGSYRCPVCSTTLDKVSRTGFLGCDRCYEIFAPTVEKMLSKIQPSTNHKGKLSGADGKRIERDNTVRDLKEDLKRAIIDENYEQAAVLRDKIREYESKGDEQNG